MAGALVRHILAPASDVNYGFVAAVHAFFALISAILWCFGPEGFWLVPLPAAALLPLSVWHWHASKKAAAPSALGAAAAKKAD
jgi:hypothetical protein